MKILYRYLGIIVTGVFTLLLLKYVFPIPKTTSFSTRENMFSDAVYFQSYKMVDNSIAGQARQKSRKNINLRKYYKINVKKSDVIPINRHIPDSRPPGCKSIRWPDRLPSTSVVITYHNEWPSILLRTIFSVVNRTPKEILREIILIDDFSTDPVTLEIQNFLKNYSLNVKIIFVPMPTRQGLVQARLEGMKHVTGDVVSFLDSHMEVNRNWLEPLLLEISRDPRTLVMGHLDYIDSKTLNYNYITDYRTRYGMDWRMHFFETYFREDQTINTTKIDTLPGVLAVGSAFAIDVKFFKEIGTYDENMKIWGGDNIELSLKVWLCGGRVLHVACSKVGHIARDQPYSFLDDRLSVEMFNYKRIIEVWFDDYKKYVYDVYPQMKDINIGELSDQFQTKKRLKCKPFRWFLDYVWPELFPFRDNVKEWGMIERRTRNEASRVCLDNNKYLFSMPSRLLTKPCTGDYVTQMMALTQDKHLRSTLQCIVVIRDGMDYVPYLQGCARLKNISTWEIYGTLRNIETDLCLEITDNGLIMDVCNDMKPEQRWSFRKPVLKVI